MSRLDEIKERERKAIDGPWYRSGVFVDIGTGKRRQTTIDIPRIEDAIFICECRSDIPYLIKRLEAAEEALRQYQGLILTHPYMPTAAFDYFDTWALP